MKVVRMILMAILVIVTSCKNDANSPNYSEIERLNKENQELKIQLQNKDEEVNSFIRSFNQIQENLNTIKLREKLLKENTNEEFAKTKQEQIADDINSISELLAKNKEQIALLKRKLTKSSTKIEEFEKMIASLNEQITQKDNDIALLKEELGRANSAYKELFIDYMAKIEEVEDTKEELKLTNEKLNTAFYAFGTAKELIEKKVITKEGGFIGLGKAEKMRNDFNSDYFTQIDINSTRTIDTKAKKCKIITTHPNGSYKWEMRGKWFDKLVINDPDKFWSASKYLVIVVEN